MRQPAGIGDFSGDGKANIATFYRHDVNIWYGTARAAQPAPPWHVATASEGDRLTPRNG